jgi:hypothetical protein
MRTFDLGIKSGSRSTGSGSGELVKPIVEPKRLVPARAVSRPLVDPMLTEARAGQGDHRSSTWRTETLNPRSGKRTTADLRLTRLKNGRVSGVSRRLRVITTKLTSQVSRSGRPAGSTSPKSPSRAVTAWRASARNASSRERSSADTSPCENKWLRVEELPRFLMCTSWCCLVRRSHNSIRSPVGVGISY